MTPEQFAERCMQHPQPRYVRWRSGFDACDCYGLIVLYWREVHGRELLPEPQTASGMADGFAALGQHWAECGPQPGACGFMAFDADDADDAYDAGVPRHCGVLLPGGRLLHIEAPSLMGGGHPRLTPLRALVRLYPDVRFYRPEPGAFAA